MATADRLLLSTDEWEADLGEQFRTMRIRTNLEQVELATKANVSVGAIKNLESGRGSSLKTLIKVARALNRTDWLEALAPKVSVSPMQMLKANSKTSARQKVYRQRKSSKRPE